MQHVFNTALMLFSILFMMASGMACAASYEEGKHYKRVDQPKTFDGDKVSSRALAVARTVVQFTESYRDTPPFDIDGYRHAVRLWTIVLEISVTMAQFPSKEIAIGSYDYRTLGLGYANLGSLLMRMGIPYDSDHGRGIAGALTAILTGNAYATSAEMAGVLGPFPKYHMNMEAMLRVIRNHRRAARGVARDAEEYEALPIRPVPICSVGELMRAVPRTTLTRLPLIPMQPSPRTTRPEAVQQPTRNPRTKGLPRSTKRTRLPTTPTRPVQPLRPRTTILSAAHSKQKATRSRIRTSEKPSCWMARRSRHCRCRAIHSRCAPRMPAWAATTSAPTPSRSRCARPVTSTWKRRARQTAWPVTCLSLAVSSMFVLLMAGLILYETSNIIHGGETNYIMATVTLFVAIFNLFTSLLHLLGAFGGDE